jgi:hypothetical protein
MSTPPVVRGSLSAAFDLFETGVRLMRQNLRRQHPEASEADIDRLLDAWLRDRPADAEGRVVDPGTRLK